MAPVTALLAGAAVGATHALESDHVAAVATLVTDEHDPRSAGLVGVSWGVGHSLPIVALGLLFVAIGIRLPESVTVFFEAVVGVVLVVLGLRLLADTTEIHAHVHDDHGEDGVHSHLHVGSLALGSDHAHVDADSFLVGIVHGIAGSGALVVALVATAPTVASSLTFLLAFSALSILTMAGVSLLWGQSLGTGLTRYLEGGAAVVGLVVGGSLLYETVGGLVTVPLV